MEVKIISIGNSKGIRIPKALLEQLSIENRVSLTAAGNKLIIKPLKDNPRAGWEEKFKAMHENGDDQLLIDDALDLESEDWEW